MRGTIYLLVLFSVTTASATRNSTGPVFSADRYPTGIRECSWLNWIADRIHVDDMDSVKGHVVKSIQSLNTSQWEGIGNGIITASVITDITKYISNITCNRDSSMIGNCVGLSDIGCKFKKYAAHENSIIFNKTDGAVASPPNHKVLLENSQLRVINVYCPPASLELAFHTHTRLSFWISWGSSRGERYYGYNGTVLFDEPAWDRKEGSVLKVLFNGPEWFHMLEEKEPDDLAPGNCPTNKAPSCSNGFKYRVELKLDDLHENYGLSQVRRMSDSEAIADWSSWLSRSSVTDKVS